MHIQHLFAKIPRDGSTVDLQPLFFQLTLDSATEFLFGESVDVLRSPAGSEQQLFGQAFDYAQMELPSRSRLGPFLWLYRNKEFDVACKRVHSFVDQFVLKALEYRRSNRAGKKDQEKEGGKYIFANELALATDDPMQIRAELLNILLAGRDTTAGLLSNTFWVLAHRPDVWAKLKSEIDQLDGERPDYETLRNMKYLKFVLNECKCNSCSAFRNLAYTKQLCACTPQYQATPASPTRAPQYPSVAGPMANRPSSSPKAEWWRTQPTPCTATRLFTAKMQRSTSQSAGKRCG